MTEDTFIKASMIFQELEKFRDLRSKFLEKKSIYYDSRSENTLGESKNIMNEIVESTATFIGWDDFDEKYLALFEAEFDGHIKRLKEELDNIN